MKKNVKLSRRVMVAAAGLLVALTVSPTQGLAYSNDYDVYEMAMYRLYNPNSGEHFYTGRAAERDALVKVGWKSEGTGWYAPTKSDTPVYRLYNPNAGDHHYTTNKVERDSLKKVGWRDEGIGWYSDDDKSIPLYRQYNPNAKTGTHNYTTSKGENDQLVKLGWRAEGIGWYGLDTGSNTGKKWVAEQGHYEDVYEDERYWVEPVFEELGPTWRFSDGHMVHTKEEARAYAIESGASIVESTANKKVLIKDGYYATRKVKTGTKWVVDVPGHWE